MKHFLFTDQITGEDFLVGADSVFDAYELAHGIFGAPSFLGVVTEFEAEASGLDEY